MTRSVSQTTMSIILGLVAAVGPFAIDMYLPAMPDIGRDLAASQHEVQWTIVGYFITFGLAQLVYGPWADQAGRKPPLYVGLALFILGTVTCALAPSLGWLVLGRMVQGAGGAANMVVLRAVIRDMATGPAATRMMSTIMIVIAVSPLLAPLSGAGLLAIGSWRLVFWALLAASLLSALLIHFAVPETLSEANRQRFDLTSFLRGSRSLLTNRSFLVMTFLAGFAFASFFVFIASASFVYIGQFGLTATQFSLAFAVNAIGFFVASQFSATIAVRVGTLRMIRRATIGFSLATFAGFGLALAGLASLPVTMTTLFIGNMFLGVLMPSAQVQALEEHGAIAGLAASLGGTLQMLAAGALVVAAGPFLDGTVTPMLGAIALCGALVLVLSRIIPRQAARA
ncbi:multidrug effflux MFS transporter [Tabrizicola sp.]|uniref:multidrug effflux MFS transporter n=1 Tax=Tabrizicola sp. TaxID=2005166 RepID=UPI001A61E2AA|nr:multidrug effflux MFS transporter [Tabrizicola sp.]MBL9064361.1 multidrug effflux MFS transporter [Tabrizicola sp.]